MKKIATPIEDLFVIENIVFKDERGYFFESFHQKKFFALGISHSFIQDNESMSSYGTVRGLHLQKSPKAQTKLVRVIQGEILDVAVDVRPKSKTFGHHFKCRLSGDNKKMLLIPRGFLHGFSVCSETATVIYKCDQHYDAAAEVGVRFDDPNLAIDWEIPIDKVILSAKDQKNISFSKVAWNET